MSEFEGFRLSAAQLQAWRRGGEPLCARVELGAHLDRDRLTAALAVLAARHEALRLSLADYPGLRVPLQRIADTATLDMTLDGATLLLRGPAWQVDGFSLRLLVQELAAVYSGATLADDPDRLQFLDVAQWQAEQPPPSREPDLAPIALPGGEGRTVHVALGADLGVPRESAVLAAWALALSRYHDSPGAIELAYFDDGRAAAGTAGVVGALACYAPLRLPIPLPTDARALLDTVDAALAAARSNHQHGQPLDPATPVTASFALTSTAATTSRPLPGEPAHSLPGESVQRPPGESAHSLPGGPARPLPGESVHLSGELGRPLPSESVHLLSGESARPLPGEPPPLSVVHVEIGRPEPFAAVHLDADIVGDKATLRLTGGSPALVEAAAAILSSLPEALAGGALRLLGKAETAQLLSFSHAPAPSPEVGEATGRAVGEATGAVAGVAGSRAVGEAVGGAVTLTELLDRGLRRDPAALAVIAPDGEVTHAELDEAAERIADSLAASGVGVEDRVLVRAARSWRTVAAFVGVLRAGAVYVPVDPDQPESRIAMLAETVNAAVILDGADPPISGAAHHRPQIEATNAAYAIFTSGSTGTPRPVVVEHRSAVNLCHSLARAVYPAPGGQLRVTVNAPFTFDASIKQLVQLAHGHTLCVLDDTLRRTPEAMLAYLREQRVDVLDITPSHLRVLLYAARDRQRLPGLVLVGGEAIDEQLWQRLAGMPQTRVVNLYGPTECTVDATAAVVDAAASPSIGRPLPGVGAFILDEHFHLVPTQAPGELCLTGVQVARGYGVTARVAGEQLRVYRTGDRARFTADGRIEFLGRLDHQLKISGYRIEPEEAASLLRKHPAVADAAVLAVSGSDGEPRLAAFVSARTQSLDPQRIAGVNPHETRYLYDEIFVRRSYLRGGITLPGHAVVFDVGANIGMFTLFARAVCPTARVYAFEPLRAAYEKLERNVGGEATLFDIGLSDHDHVAQFAFYPGYSMMSGRREYADPRAEVEVIKRYLANEGGAESAQLLSAADELLAERFAIVEESCRLRRLSDVIAEAGVDRIDLLKIDVQRAELEVLRGLDERHWPLVRQIVMEVHDDIDGPTRGRLAEVTQLLRQHGFGVVAEQEELLVGTDRHTVYAVRRGITRQATDAAPALDTNGLRSWLGEHLPSYLIPSTITVLDELPRTRNGKTDLAALSTLEVTTAQAREEPENEAEQALAKVWREVLGLDDIGVTENFFSLGGDSIRAIRMRAAAQREGLEFPLRSVFRHQTIRALVREENLAPAAAPAAASPAAAPAFGMLSAADQAKLPQGLQDAYPATVLQQGMLYHSALSEGQAAYHVVTCHHVPHPLDVARLRQALAETAAAHPILRTSFDLGTFSQAVQLVHRQASLPLEVEQVGPIPAMAQRARLAAAIAQEREKPLDWREAPLVRVRAVDMGETFEVVVTHHHAVLDGWSLHLFVAELLARYEHDGYQAPPALAVSRFVELEAEAREDSATLAFWQDSLRGVAPVLVGAAPVPVIGNDLSQEIAADVVAGLGAAAAELGVPVKSLLLGAYLRAMGELTGRDDLVSGLVISARPAEAGADRSLGLFLNTVPLRMALGKDSVRTLAQRVWRAESEMMGHHLLPGADIAKACGHDRFFDAFFNYTRFHNLDGTVRYGGRDPIGDAVPVDVAFTLIVDFEASPDGQQMRLTVQYDASQVELARARQLAARIQELLACPQAELPPVVEWGEPWPERLAALWRELLGVTPQGRDADFVAAGGDSLLALRLVAALRDRFGVKVSLARLRAEPTFSAILRQIEPSRPVIVDRHTVAQVVAQEWQAALELAEPAAEADFFALGGNSLMALAMAQRIERRLGTPFPIDVLFLDGTLAAVTAACTEVVP